MSEDVLAFRLARCVPPACPASDFARDAALLALAARADGLTREAHDAAVDRGELVVAHLIRGAIHAVVPGDIGLWGRALLGRDDAELGAQMGGQVRKLERPAGEALAEVAEATAEILAAGPLARDELHAAWRDRVDPALMPWCRGCGSHHVAPMLWRYATVAAGVVLDSARRYRLGRPGRTPAAAEAVRRFLRFYGPSTVGEFAGWAGLSASHARRLWDQVASELAPVGRAWLLAEDLPAFAEAPAPRGVLLLPPGDPFLQKPNRILAAPDEGLRRRLFRPVASPGAVVRDGRVAGLWRVRGKELAVELTGHVPGTALREQADRVATAIGRPLALVLP